MTVAHPPAVTEELVTVKRIARSLHVSQTSILKMTANGDFPKPIPLAVRRYLYRRSDLDQFWRERLGGKNGEPFPLLPEEPGDTRRR
jgi:predicted DNA-binding transcriptional regulator AlpA